MLAINPRIKQKAEDIRSKIFGSEVRESLASGIEAISEDVEATIGRQDYVEEQFQNVIDETTDKDVISAPELIAARNGKSNLKTRLDDEHAQVTAQLQQTKPIKYLNSIPNTSTLPEGYIGVVPHEEVVLKVTSSIPATGAENVKCHTPIFVDFNMPVDKSTITVSSVRLMDGETNVVMLRGFDSVNNRMVLYPTPQLAPNKTYTLEITDGVRSLQGYTVGTNSKHQIVFKTGELTDMRLNDNMNDVDTNWTKLLTGTPTVSSGSGYTQLKVAPGQEVILDALDGEVTFTVDYLIKPVNVQVNASMHLRQVYLGQRRIVSLRKTGDTVGTALDYLESNVINKQRNIDMTDFIHVKISRKEDGTVNAWVNGFEMFALKGGVLSGGRIQIVVTGGSTSSEWEIHHVLAPNEYEVI